MALTNLDAFGWASRGFWCEATRTQTKQNALFVSWGLMDSAPEPIAAVGGGGMITMRMTMRM